MNKQTKSEGHQNHDHTITPLPYFWYCSISRVAVGGPLILGFSFLVEQPKYLAVTSKSRSFVQCSLVIAATFLIEQYQK